MEVQYSRVIRRKCVDHDYPSTPTRNTAKKKKKNKLMKKKSTRSGVISYNNIDNEISIILSIAYFGFSKLRLVPI